MWTESRGLLDDSNRWQKVQATDNTKNGMHHERHELTEARNPVYRQKSYGKLLPTREARKASVRMKRQRFRDIQCTTLVQHPWSRRKHTMCSTPGQTQTKLQKRRKVQHNSHTTGGWQEALPITTYEAKLTTSSSTHGGNENCRQNNGQSDIPCGLEIERKMYDWIFLSYTWSKYNNCPQLDKVSKLN